MKNKLKIIFAGTPDFAVPALQALMADADFELAAVITQEDKPVGRKQTLTPPPVKVFALANNIPVWQPKKLKDMAEDISKLSPDFIIVVAYGKLLPESILAIPKYGCVNIHASLLPRWRGAAVIQAPILAGDTETGITIMKMDKGLDTGPIIAQMKVNVLKNETAETLHDELSKLGAKMLPETLKAFAAGKMELKKQDKNLMTYAPELKKEDGKIDWSKPALEIERKIRAFTPWPGTHSVFNYESSIINKTIKIIEVENRLLPINEYKIGEIFVDDKKMAVQCGNGALIIKRLQLDGGKPLSAEEFWRGHADFIGTILQ